MKDPKFEFTQGRDYQWRWRFRAANGRIVAVCGEGYKTKRGVVRAARMMLALTEDMKLQVAIANAIREAEGQR